MDLKKVLLIAGGCLLLIAGGWFFLHFVWQSPDQVETGEEPEQPIEIPGAGSDGSGAVLDGTDQDSMGVDPGFAPGSGLPDAETEEGGSADGNPGVSAGDGTDAGSGNVPGNTSSLFGDLGGPPSDDHGSGAGNAGSGSSGEQAADGREAGTGIVSEGFGELNDYGLPVGYGQEDLDPYYVEGSGVVNWSGLSSAEQMFEGHLMNNGYDTAIFERMNREARKQVIAEKSADGSFKIVPMTDRLNLQAYGRGILDENLAPLDEAAWEEWKRNNNYEELMR